MKILVVEDDYVQSQWILMNLKKTFGSQPQWIETESQFRDNVKKIAANPPDVVIMDVMLSWTEASENMTPRPPEVRQEGMYRAGLRCQEILSNLDETKNVPVILYTVQNLQDLERDLKDMPPNVLFLPKEANIDPLIERIDELVAKSSDIT